MTPTSPQVQQEKTSGSSQQRPSVAQTQGRETPTHEHRTAKIIELVCSSTKDFQDAIQNGLRDASQSVEHITGADVSNMSVHCVNGKITEYRVDLRVAFGVERRR